MLNNIGTGIHMVVSGNAGAAFGRIGNMFQKFISMLPPGAQQYMGMLAKMGLTVPVLAAAAGAFAALTIAIGKCMGKAQEFQYGMAEVSTLLDKQGMEELPRLKNQVLGLAVAYGKGTEDLTKATYQAISAGIAAKEAGGFLGVAGKLAIGGVTNMETAVDGLTSIKNAYGLALEDMTDVSDKMFVAMRAGKTTIEELSNTIGNVAPIASTMNIAIGDVLAMVATLTKGGINTARAVTGIRAAMLEVMRASPKFVKAAEQYGIQYDLATVRQMGFAKWLSYANEKITAQGGKMTDLFSNVRALTAVLTLAGKGEKVNAEIMDQMAQSAGESERAFQKMSKTTKFMQGQAKQARETFMIEFGEFFDPLGKAWAKFKMVFWGAIKDVWRWFKTNFVDRVVYILKPVIKILEFVGKIVGMQWIINFKMAGKAIAFAFRIATVPLRLMADLLRWIIRYAEKVPDLIMRAMTKIPETVAWVWKWIRRLSLEIEYLVDRANIAAEVAGAVTSGNFREAGMLRMKAVERASQREKDIVKWENWSKGLAEQIAKGVFVGMDGANKEKDRKDKKKGPQQTEIVNPDDIGEAVKGGTDPATWARTMFHRDFVAVR